MRIAKEFIKTHPIGQNVNAKREKSTRAYWVLNFNIWVGNDCKLLMVSRK